MTMKVRALLGLLMLSAAILIGCGHYVCKATFGSSSCAAPTGGLGQGGTGNAAAFEFFVEQEIINAAFVDTSGNFNQIPGFQNPTATVTVPAIDAMVVVQKQWLYIAQGPKILAYSINGATGALTALTGSPFTSPETETGGFIADPAGHFLFQSGANTHEVAVFAINQTSGALTVVGSPVPTGTNFAGDITTDGLGKYLYVTESNLGQSVAVFSIGTTGALTPIAVQSIQIAVLKGEATGKFLFGVTGNGVNNTVLANDPHIYIYSIDQTTGTITQLGLPFQTTNIPFDLRVHPSGPFVYAFTAGSNTTGDSAMEGYKFDTTGTLTAVTGSPFTALTVNDGVFDESGAFFFMHPNTSLTVASVDKTTGAITLIAAPITPVGLNQGFVATDPH